MILFVGDSFTYGQGLQYYYLTQQKGWSWKDCENFFNSHQRFESLGFEENEFRRQNSFPYIVSKTLNTPFQVLRIENGGDNYVSYEIIKNLQPLCTPETIDYIVVQFSSPIRSILQGTEPKLQTIEEQIHLQVSRISDFCKDFGVKWIGISWQNEIGDILKINYPKNYTPIQYKNKEYSCFDCNIHPILRPLFIEYTESVKDGHFNIEGHEVIANSIIHKIQNKK